ncbi:hypothetical protein [Klebsiella phage vB_KpnP_ZX1]|nr:hypothetical protein [Klebsiella phage vB_KpnP_ZX1]
MNNNQLTKERLQEIAEDGFLKHGESKVLARMALAATDGEPVVWNNGCNKSVPAALRYLAENPRPIGGESSFNTAHLYQLAREIELMAEAPLYRHAQPAPVVPDELLNEIDDLLSVCRVYACRSRRNGSENDIPRTEKAQNWLRVCRAAMLPAAPACTCPSGDGSLRWPCPVHPGNSPVVPDGIERVASMAEYLGNFAAAAIIRQLAANQPQNAPQNIPEIIPDSCTWTFSNYDDHWSGTCGVEWIFPDGGPEENGVKFCPKCGKSVAIPATE